MARTSESDDWRELAQWRNRGGNTRLEFNLKQRLIFSAASAAFRLVGRWITATQRLALDDPHGIAEDFMSGRKNYIFACWHNRLVGAVLFYGANCCRRFGKLRIGPMVSESFDGEIIARCVRDVGGENVRGSSSSRGVEGLKEAVEEARRGLNVVVTGDGPRGPRYELKPGVILLAKLARLPIVPVSWSCDRTAQLHRSWDQLMIPLPHANVRFHFGEPLFVPESADARGIARARRDLEARMADLARRTDVATRITWQIPKPKPGEKLKKRKVAALAADKRL